MSTMNPLKLWLDQQFAALQQEHVQADIGQYKREGMLLAVETVLNKVEELENGQESNIDEGSPEEGAVEEGTEG